MANRTTSPIRTRVWRLPDNTLLFVRFTFGQQIQHWTLLLAVSTLAVTGFTEKFSDAGWAVFLINLFGGLDVVQVVHRFFSIVLIVLAACHLISAVYGRIVNAQPWSMMLGRRDWRSAAQLLGYDLGITDKRPRFGHYTVEEKVTYWVTAISVVIMAGTGLLMSFPTRTAEFLPGAVVPLARIVHGWQAIIIVAFIVIVHLYQTVLRAFNPSIFTGHLPEDQMQREHALEYAAILEQLGAQPTGTSKPEESPVKAADENEAGVDATTQAMP